MNKDNFAKNRWFFFALILLLFLALVGVLATSLVLSARERAALEAEREEYSKQADRDAASETTALRPSILTGLQQLAAGVAPGTYYFGDDTILGRGMTSTPTLAARSYRTLFIDEMEDARGISLAGLGFVHTDPPTPPLSALAGFRQTNYRLLLLTPTARTATASGCAMGEMLYDLETLLREVRSTAPLCDIILTAPHDAEASTAETMRDLAEHYGLVFLDMRAVFALGEGLVHTEGADLGYPTEAGHHAYAEAMVEAVLDAADGGHTSPACPKERLLTERKP